MIDSMFGFDDSFIHACVLHILLDSTLKEHIDEQAITTVGAQVDQIAQSTRSYLSICRAHIHIHTHHSMQESSCTAHWTVHSEFRFRFFRLKMTGPNAAGCVLASMYDVLVFARMC